MGILQQGLPTETLDGQVGHAVAQNNNVLHKEQKPGGRTARHTILDVSD
jgi:hypothetical protein